MSKQDGGEAFPCPGMPSTGVPGGFEFQDRVAPKAGMSLRDYFAAKAMQAIYTRFGGAACVGSNYDGTLTMAAESAYLMADAMLAARNSDRGDMK